ncbi:MAG: glycine cleavage system aminomethyltransferase GcvT [Syntrophobacterales bacterium]|nr:glycine cleavage system aminomethyltransferase GcvT [Syntrophobacterales bacterium]
MQRTPLYDRHLKLGARMIDFGGWEMPVQYTTVIDEHRATREAAGLFDTCHMGEIDVTGPGSYAFLQRVLSRDLAGMTDGRMRLSLLTDHRGGIIDDLTVYRLGDDRYRLVTNAVTKDKDLIWLRRVVQQEGFSGVEIMDVTDRTGKLDLQGPRSAEILQSLVADSLSGLKFYDFIETEILGLGAVVSRSGYTGEDGFEVYVPAEAVGKVWDKILEAGTPLGLKPAGLGARDTLRLEAGMMLYGNEMNESVTPFEVVYGWATDLKKDFIGSEALRKQKGQGIRRKLTGFELTGRGIARHGYAVFKNGRAIGEVTSGTFSPTLQKAIGMAFVPVEHSEPGTQVDIRIRDNRAEAHVVPLPFYKRKIV